MWLTPPLFPPQPITLGWRVWRANILRHVHAVSRAPAKNPTCSDSANTLQWQPAGFSGSACPACVQMKGRRLRTAYQSHPFRPLYKDTHVSLCLVTFREDWTTWGLSVTKACWLWTGEAPPRRLGELRLAAWLSRAPLPPAAVAWASDFTSQSLHCLSCHTGGRHSLTGLWRLGTTHGRGSTDSSYGYFQKSPLTRSDDGLGSCLSLTGTKSRAKINKCDLWKWFQKAPSEGVKAVWRVPRDKESVYFIRGKKP